MQKIRRNNLSRNGEAAVTMRPLLVRSVGLSVGSTGCTAPPARSPSLGCGGSPTNLLQVATQTSSRYRSSITSATIIITTFAAAPSIVVAFPLLYIGLPDVRTQPKEVNRLGFTPMSITYFSFLPLLSHFSCFVLSSLQFVRHRSSPRCWPSSCLLCCPSVCLSTCLHFLLFLSSWGSDADWSNIYRLVVKTERTRVYTSLIQDVSGLSRERFPNQIHRVMCLWSLVI